jgi:hypothetical protein
LVLQYDWRLGVGLKTPPRKTFIVTKLSKKEKGGQSSFRAIALRKKKKKTKTKKRP